jgi:hypothetical protein
VHARKPASNAACDVPYARRLFRGATRSPVYSAPSLRFSPACRDKRCVGSDASDQPSSAGSKVAKNCKSEGQDSAIVGEARRIEARRRCHYSGVWSLILRPQRGLAGSCSPRLVHGVAIKWLCPSAVPPGTRQCCVKRMCHCLLAPTSLLLQTNHKDVPRTENQSSCWSPSLPLHLPYSLIQKKEKRKRNPIITVCAVVRRMLVSTCTWIAFRSIGTALRRRSTHHGPKTSRAIESNASSSTKL